MTVRGVQTEMQHEVKCKVKRPPMSSGRKAPDEPLTLSWPACCSSSASGFSPPTSSGSSIRRSIWRRRPTALLTWPGRRPPFFQMQIGIGVALALLFLFDVFVRPSATEQIFGVGMMCVYYAGIVPLSARIERGFYRDGVWSDRRFIRYRSIGAITWREDPEPVLLLASRARQSAARLAVPGHLFGAVRRVLRDLIARRELALGETGLHLGLRDERDDA